MRSWAVLPRTDADHVRRSEEGVNRRLPLERVRHLEEELAGGGQQLVAIRLDPRRELRGQDTRLAVPDEQHRLPVEVVAEQEGAVEAALLRRHPAPCGRVGSTP